MKTSKSGFTIVELLIVIVVIAILAVITVVTYNGIQSRAKASQATSVANAYIKLIKMYKAEHGHYPSTGAPNTAPYYQLSCLGRPSDFPATGNYLAGECNNNYNKDGSWSWKGLANDTLANALAPYGRVQQSVYNPTIGSDASYAEEWRGVRYDPDTSTNPTMVFVQWSIKGNNIPGCGPGVSSSNTTYKASINLTQCGVFLN